MTPKEKAEELVKKFDLPTGLMSRERIQCALIAVEEILNEYSVLAIETSFTYQYYKFWQSVKKELLKM